MPTLNWIGKDAVLNHHLDVPFCTLERKYTFGAEDSENKIIHGDNLEALKSLLPEYEGRIKCIYIDPPYNTGNEGWVYNDNVRSPKIQKWLGEVVGKEAEDLTRHDKWLCMMYPRLKLLQRLLADDGAIFISIDDNEQANLKLICDEIFGAKNFVGQILVKRKGGRQDSKFVAVVHEYCLCYAKSVNEFTVGLDIKENSVYPKFDKEKNRYYKTQLLRKWGSNSLRENRPNLYYPIKGPNGENIYPVIYKDNGATLNEIEGCWRWSAGNMSQQIADGNVEFQVNKYGKFVPYEKIYAPLTGDVETKKFTTWQEETGNGTNLLKAIFGSSVFDYPKSVNLIELFIKIAKADKDSLILDSFAGSGTTAHAVLNLNKEDGGNRKFILIEMEDYADSITAERVRRVIAGYGEGSKAVEGISGDFSFYELGEPIFVDGNLNQKLSTEEIRSYVWYSETHSSYKACEDSNPYLLGRKDNTDYYFYYEADSATVLNMSFLATITTTAEQYIIYADNCVVPQDIMQKHHIVFKKIPRDIKQF